MGVSFKSNLSLKKNTEYDKLDKNVSYSPPTPDTIQFQTYIQPVYIKKRIDRWRYNTV